MKPNFSSFFPIVIFYYFLFFLPPPNTNSRALLFSHNTPSASFLTIFPFILLNRIVTRTTSQRPSYYMSRPPKWLP